MRKLIHLVLTLTAVALSAIAVVGCSAKAKKARDLERGDRYFGAGQYDKAEIEYRNALQIDPKNLQALSRLGLIYFEQGRLPWAFPFLYEAHKLEPTNLDLHMKLGLIYLAGRKLKEARDEAMFVLDRRPQDEEAPLLLAETAVTAKAINETRQRLQQLPSPALERAPCQVALATLDFHLHDFKAAEAGLKRAQTLDPKSSAAYAALGGLYWAQNDLKRAEQAFQTAAELAPARSSRRLQYARFKIQTGDLAAGKRIFEQIVQRTPDYLPGWTGLAEIAFVQKKYDECAALIGKILARDPGNYETLLLSGRLRLAKGEIAKAVAELEAMTKKYPQAPQVYYQLALAYLGTNDTAKTAASLKQAVALDPDSTEAIILLAGLNITKGDLSSAIISLKQLAQRHPQLAQAQILLADAYRAQGNLDDALATCRHLMELLPKSPQVPFLTGAILFQQNKRTEARHAFEKALELNPDYFLALEQMVNLDLVDKQYAAALQRVQTQLEKNPKQPEPRLLQARIFLAQGDKKQAEAALLKAVELRPDSDVAYLQLARLYIQSNQRQKALENLRTAAAKNPKDVAALMTIAMICNEEGNYTAAGNWYEKLLSVDPKFSSALNNLAYLYSEHLGQVEKAYELARRARDLHPTDPFTADTLGWILYHKKQYPSALSLLQESASKLPNQPEVQFHLGMAYYQMGQEDAARAAFQRVQQSDQDFPGKGEAGRRLSLLAIDVKTAGTEARAGLEKRLAEQPDDPIALARLAAIYERDGAVEKAVGAYQATLQANPKNVRALINLAQLYSARLKDLQKGIELAKAAYKLAPDDAEVSGRLGRLAYQTGDYKWALSLLQETARQQPDDAEVLYDLAEADYSMGHVADAQEAMQHALQIGTPFSRSNEAKRFLEMIALSADPSRALAAESRVDQILKSDPAYVPGLMVVGVICERKPNTSLAKQTYEKVLNRYPDFTPAARRLTILYAQDPSNDRKSYELAIKAREAFPDDPDVAKAVGIIAYRQGDYARSAILLKESASKQNKDALVMYYLGMSQYRLKKPVDGKLALQRALDLSLSGEPAAEARRVLAESK